MAGAASGNRALFSAWIGSGFLLVAFAVSLTWISPRFGYAHDVAAMPVLTLVAGLVAAGLLFCFGLPTLIRASVIAHPRATSMILACVFLAGLAARLALLASEPILEDDHHRYLWDGAVSGAGLNPYAVSPLSARSAGPDTTIGRLARESGFVQERINHAELRSIYPPVAQAAFALANAMAPWSLLSWRLVIGLLDLATFGLVLLLLRACGRSPLWSALYWWNPLVIKELFNSAHMEPVVLAPVLLALLLAAHRHLVSAAAGLAIASGAKLWPVLLLGLVARPLISTPRDLIVALSLFAGIIGLMAIPVISAGVDSSSGFLAYADRWQTNSALFPLLERTARALSSGFGTLAISPGHAARIGLTLILLIIALELARKNIVDADDLMGRASLVVAALVLLSPAQFPWYAVWLAPFLAWRPWTSLLLLSATQPLYYVRFHLIAHDQPAVLLDALPWLIWVPIWIALLIELFSRWAARPAGVTRHA